MNMKYITKVGDVHVIEINGTNHQVKECPVKYMGDDERDRITFNGCVIGSDFTVSLKESATHLAQIVLAVQVAKFIRAHNNK